MTADKKNIIVLLGILCTVTFIAFSPALKNGFTNCDDTDYVTHNPMITELSWKNIKTMFTTTSVFYIYHPLVHLSYAVEHHFFKLKPFPYHLTNLLLHIMNTVLVFYLILTVSRNKSVAFFTALMFGIHPLRVESVAWVTERKDVLYSAFYLSSLTAYLGYASEKHARARYGLSLGLFFMSLLSKPMAVTLPAVLILLDYLNGRKIGVRTLAEKIPFFALSLVFTAVNMSSHYPADQSRVEAGFTLTHKLLNGFHGIPFHIGKLLAPDNLCCLYQHPQNFVNTIPFSYYCAPVIVALLCIAFLFSARYSRKGLFGFLFFLVTILPVLQFLPVGGKSTPADRFTYIPAIGLFYAAGEFFYWLGWKRFSERPAVKILLIGTLAAVVCVFSFHTYRMCGVWKDSVTLWTNVLKYYPDNLVSFSNRASGYLERGEIEKAIADCNDAIRIEPRYFIPYHTRANARMMQGRPDLAVADYTAAIELCPRSRAAACFYNRGNAFAGMKEHDKAISDYSQAIELQPLYAEAFHNRASACNDRGETESALADYAEAIRLAPRYTQAYFNRGNVFAKRGELEKALADYNQALSLNPGFLPAYLGRAGIYARKGEHTKAWADVQVIERHGYTVDPAFIEELEKASPRPLP